MRRTPRPGEAIGRPGPCIITAAIVGAETTREQNPYLPLTPEELGEEAARCAAAGATVIHLHVRDEQGRASQDTERFRAAIRAIRARCDVIIQTSTGGAVGMSVEERCGPLRLSGADRPEMATLNVGTINFGDDIFVNRRPDTMDIARRIRAAGLHPEVEIYDLSHIEIAAELVRHELLQPPLHVQFVLGVRGALGASLRNLELLVQRLADLPGPVSWAVAGIGRHQLPMVEAGARLGGHVRVGLEDNIYLDKGVLAQGSAPLVARAAELVRACGRTVATIDQARALLTGAARA
ncbi:MAG: 3-keto-5-aminohexanoate cleavage protein [Myxococcales bacterium]|nr:3-keto-5-aminohexanoate cleavage protein [Myxococcales bacterium]